MIIVKKLNSWKKLFRFSDNQNELMLCSEMRTEKNSSRKNNKIKHILLVSSQWLKSKAKNFTKYQIKQGIILEYEKNRKIKVSKANSSISKKNSGNGRKMILRSKHYWIFLFCFFLFLVSRYITILFGQYFFLLFCLWSSKCQCENHFVCQWSEKNKNNQIKYRSSNEWFMWKKYIYFMFHWNSINMRKFINLYWWWW